MRVLLVSNMYAYPGNWDKLDALGHAVDLAAVMPARWQSSRELHSMTRVPANATGASWKQYRLDTLYQANGNPFRYFYHPLQLAQAIAEFKPDILHVEQEPESLSLLQLSLYKLRYKYRLIFVAWENIHPLHQGFLFRGINFNLADAGIVGNKAAYRRCRRLGFRKRMSLIPQYGFSIDPKHSTAGERNGQFVIGYAGRLVPEKGIMTLVNATRKLPRVKLVIAGDGPLAAAIAHEPHVDLLGTIPRSELDAFWGRIDLFVLPSMTTPIWAEQFGRVLVEAMGAGVPVVGSSSGAIPEVISDAGLIFPEGDVEALATAITRIRNNPSLRQDLITKGFQRIETTYSYDKIIGRTVRFYKIILKLP